MPAAVAAFFDSLPNWAQGTVAALIAIGTIIFAWKGVVPLFWHRVPKFHRAGRYCRDQIMTRNGEPVTKGPGPRVQFPGVISYLDTDMRQQTTTTEGFTVDIGVPAVTYYVKGFVIVWQVVDVYLFQSFSADAEQFISHLVMQAGRDVLVEERDVNLSKEVITQRCNRRIPTLSDAGVKLVSVMVTSGSYETRNHRMLDGDVQARRTVTVADES